MPGYAEPEGTVINRVITSPELWHFASLQSPSILITPTLILSQPWRNGHHFSFSSSYYILYTNLMKTCKILIGIFPGMNFLEMEYVRQFSLRKTSIITFSVARIFVEIIYHGWFWRKSDLWDSLEQIDCNTALSVQFTKTLVSTFLAFQFIKMARLKKYVRVRSYKLVFHWNMDTYNMFRLSF